MSDVFDFVLGSGYTDLFTIETFIKVLLFCMLINLLTSLIYNFSHWGGR